MSSESRGASFDVPSGGSSRRRRSPLPRSRSIYEWIALLFLGIGPVLGIWLYGAIPLWAYGSMLALSFLGCALYWIRPLIFPRTDPVQFPPGFLGLLAFVAYGVISVFRAEVADAAKIEMLKLSGYIFAYQAWSGLAREQGRWRILFSLLLVSATLMAWYAIHQHANDSRMVLFVERPAQYEMRASGAYICPNHFANLLAMMVPVAIALISLRAAGGPLRILAVYSILVILPPLYLSASRSAWIGLMAGVTVTAALLGLRKSRIRAVVLLFVVPLLIGAAGIALWMVSPLVQERVADALRGNVRLNLWRDTWAMFLDNKWFGWGPGQYRWIYPQYWHFLKMHIDPEHAHNDYLQLLAEFGIVGAVLLLGALSWALIRMISIIRSGDSERGAGMIAGFAGACAASAAHAFFDYNFHLYGNVQVLAMIAGVTVAMLFSGGHLRSLSLESKAKWVGVAVAILFLVSAGVTMQRTVADIWTTRGDRLRDRGRLDDAAAFYQRALRVRGAQAEAHRGLGFVLISRARWNLDPETKQQQLAEAEARFQRALQRNPRDLDSKIGLIRVAQMRGLNEEALAGLQDLVQRAPFHQGYWIELGLHLRSMRDFPRALEAFQKARSLGPSDIADTNIQRIQRRMAETSSGDAK